MSAYTQYQEYGGNPYTNAPAVEAGNYNGEAVNYDRLHRPEPQHEMSTYSGTSNYSGGAPAVGEGSGPMSQGSFLQLVDVTKQQIRDLSASIGELSTLHLRALSATEPNSLKELEGLEKSTQNLNRSIQGNIQRLRTDAAKEPGNNVKATQCNALRREFERQLRDFEKEELQYKQSYRTAIARQYRVANPYATEEETQQASEMDWGNEGVFQTALRSSRQGQAVSSLGLVRARHNELQMIEKSLGELAIMFEQLGQMVEIQEPIVQRTEESAIKTAEDIARGNVETDKAIEHARRARRLKWWCFFIILLVLLAVGLGVGLGLGLTKK